MILRTLRTGEVDAWLDLMEHVFTYSDRAYFAAHIANDPCYRHRDILVVEQDGQLVSSVHVYRRELHMAGSLVSCGGVGDVATHPAYRGRGYSSALLRAAVEHMRAEGCAVSLVFTHRSDHYARHGWRRVPQSRFSVALPSLPEASFETPYSVRPMQWEDPDEVGRVIDFTRRIAEPLCGPVRRDRRYWETWVRHEAKGALVALSQEDEVVAYTAHRTAMGRIMVTDLGWARGHGAALRPLLRAVARIGILQDAQRMVGPLMRRRPLLAALDALDADWQGEVSGTAMYQVVDLAELVAALEPVFIGRLREAGNHGTVCLETDGALASFEVPPAAAPSGEPTIPVDLTFRLEEETLLRILFGAPPRKEVAVEVGGEPQCDSDWIDRLFPPRDHVFWLVDSF